MDQLGALILPPRGSEAATEYYLMNFQLALFVGVMAAPSAAFDRFVHDWVVQFGLPVFLVLLYVFFDTSINLYDLLDDGEATKFDKVRQQRNLYLSLVNIVLLVANIRFFILLNSNKRLRASLELAEAKKGQ